MQLTDLERNEIQNLLYGYDCEHIPQLKEATNKIFDYVQKLVGQIEPPVKPANGGLREQLIIALASNSALIKYDWRIKERDADFITKEKIIFAEDSAKMIIKFAEAILKENDSRLSV